MHTSSNIDRQANERKSKPSFWVQKKRKTELIFLGKAIE
jgi:hypothetical protein